MDLINEVHALEEKLKNCQDEDEKSKIQKMIDAKNDEGMKARAKYDKKKCKWSITNMLKYFRGIKEDTR